MPSLPRLALKAFSVKLKWTFVTRELVRVRHRALSSSETVKNPEPCGSHASFCTAFGSLNGFFCCLVVTSSSGW